VLCRSEGNLKSPGHCGRAGSSPAPGTTFTGSSDVPTQAQLDHPHWALGFPCCPIRPSAPAVRTGRASLPSRVLLTVAVIGSRAHPESAQGASLKSQPTAL